MGRKCIGASCSGEVTGGVNNEAVRNCAIEASSAGRRLRAFRAGGVGWRAPSASHIMAPRGHRRLLACARLATSTGPGRGKPNMKGGVLLVGNYLAASNARALGED